MASHKRIVQVLLAFLFVCACAAAWPSGHGFAQGRAHRGPEDPTGPLTGDAPPDPGAGPRGGRRGPRGPDELKVYILTFSPGDHPFYKFGHNAIWIHDPWAPLGQRDRVYNYGMFAFGDPALLPKFFLGRFMYWVDGSASIGATIRQYKSEGRGVDSQELDLTMDQRLEMKRLLEENVKEENKYYKYDYYQNNCATKVRDLVDKVTNGRVAAAATAPARLTWREHTLRLTSDLVGEYVILNLVMGDLIDKKRSVWDESFIPMEFEKLLRNVTLVDEDGTERKLVKNEQTIVKAVKPPPPEDPPTFWPYSLLAGLLIGGGLAALGRAGVKKTGFRIAFGVITSFFGLLWGFFGCFFLAAWAFTDHAVGYHNENTLLCVPWAFGLVGMGINVARSRVPSTLRAYKLIQAALASTILATVVKVLPWFDQGNGFFLVFFIPFWGGAFYGIRELAKKWAEVAVTAVQGRTAPVAAAKAVEEEAPEPAAAKPKKKKKAKPTELVEEALPKDEAGSTEAGAEEAKKSDEKEEPKEEAKPADEGDGEKEEAVAAPSDAKKEREGEDKSAKEQTAD